MEKELTKNEVLLQKRIDQLLEENKFLENTIYSQRETISNKEDVIEILEDKIDKLEKREDKLFDIIYKVVIR